MADYNAIVRSNYFKVKNREKFNQFVERWSLNFLRADSVNSSRLVGFSTWDCDNGTIRAPDGDETADFIAELSAQLQSGEVAVYMEVGNEKLRYLYGYATAVNSKGEADSVSLEDIYKKARKLTTKPTLISECTY